jgi:DNA invertase Pin-like site-specific DNA recombinase
LKKAGCQTVFKDEGLSEATTKRPALLRCLKKLEHGDTLIVWKLDRLGRSLRDPKVTPQQIDHARKLIDKGEARQYVADLLNVGRSTLYRALAH